MSHSRLATSASPDPSAARLGILLPLPPVARAIFTALAPRSAGQTPQSCFIPKWWSGSDSSTWRMRGEWRRSGPAAAEELIRREQAFPEKWPSSAPKREAESRDQVLGAAARRRFARAETLPELERAGREVPPGAAAELPRAQHHMLGAVADGDALAYVVYRVVHFEDDPDSPSEVLTLKMERTPEG